MAKVLIVEDDPLISRLYLKALAFEGFDVQMAENGQIGLEKVGTFLPEIILIDIMMPVMNGVEMLAVLKNDSATLDIPVIMLTNLSDTRTAEATIKQGAVRYIVKGDYDPTDVAIMVKDILAGKGSSSSTSQAA
jgi:DNA-binding response OmpR family regulator